MASPHLLVPVPRSASVSLFPSPPLQVLAKGTIATVLRKELRAEAGRSRGMDGLCRALLSVPGPHLPSFPTVQG